MKVLIDTDPGLDDAVAIGMILSRKDIEVVGITSVVGNTNVENTTLNVLKILEAFDRKDIPVFKGVYSPILHCKHDGEYYHEPSGLGGIPDYEPDMAPLQKENAIDAINRLVHQHKGELTLIALGPLSNLALALRLNKELPSELKELVIMGGNYKGQGNISMAAEFNFFFDPIAAHVVLEDFTCPKYLVTWELSRQTILTIDDVKEYCSHDNKRSRFMKDMLKNKLEYTEKFGFCDAVAVAIATNREIVTKTHEVYATVELQGVHTKGMVVIDWQPEFRQIGDAKKTNVVIIDDFDIDLYKKLFLDSTQ